jgi:hypothetical protein
MTDEQEGKQDVETTCEHEVDKSSIVYAEDTDWIVDVRCMKCGVSGSALIDPKSVQW